MESGRLIFDSSCSSTSSRHGHMLILGGSGNPIFRGVRSVQLGLEEGSINIKRRPFFTTSSHEDLFDEEYYDEQLPEKKRRLTPEQVHLLEKSFEAENKLEPERKSELATKLGLQPRQVAVWFQNRRARWKTKQLERDFDRLKAAYDSLLADHDSLLKDNDHLRSQVASLTDKVQAKGLAATVEPTGAWLPSAADEMVMKGGDHLSTGSGGSAVVDGNASQQLLMQDSSSGDSYFQESFRSHGHCGIMGPTEEDDGSDDGCNYLPAAGGLLGVGSHDSDAADNWWGVWN